MPSNACLEWLQRMAQDEIAGEGDGHGCFLVFLSVLGLASLPAALAPQKIKGPAHAPAGSPPRRGHACKEP